MRAHYLQHVPFEGLGSIQAWLETHDYEITCTQVYQSTAFPDLSDIDLLIIMGGPMSVNDESEYPWLAAEKQYIKAAIEAGKPTLGICLGAQLISVIMGAEVYPNEVKEIGWFPIYGKAAAKGMFTLPQDVNVFHWHGETFTLPPGAIQLAQSKVCKNQAFQLGDHVIGLQFHLEVTPASVAAMVEHCRDELVAGEYIDNEQAILSSASEYYSCVNALMDKLLRFLQPVGKMSE